MGSASKRRYRFSFSLSGLSGIYIGPSSCGSTCFFLGLVTGSVSTAWLGLRLRRVDCKAAFSTQHSSLEGLTAGCMAMHFMPTSWAPWFVTWCPLTLIPSLHQACSLVQVWEAVFGFIPKKNSATQSPPCHWSGHWWQMPRSINSYSSDATAKSTRLLTSI